MTHGRSRTFLSLRQFGVKPVRNYTRFVRLRIPLQTPQPHVNLQLLRALKSP